MDHQSVEGAIRRILHRRSDGSTGACPDENLFAAYLENRLAPPETARFEEHASNCSVCQEVLGLSLRLAQQETRAAVAAASESGASLFRSSRLRLVLGAAFALTAGVILFQSARDSSLLPTKPQVAQRESKPGISGGPQAQLKSLEAATAASDSISKLGTAVAGQKDAPEAAGMEFRARVNPAKPAAEALPAAPAAANVPETVPVQTFAKADAAKAAGTDLPEELPPARKVTVQSAEMNTAAAQANENRNRAMAVPRQDAAQLQNQAVQQAAMQAPVGAAQSRAEGAAPMDPTDQALLEARAAASRGQASELKDEKAAERQKKVAGRLFYRTSGYWVDGECLLRPNAPRRDIRKDSKEYSDMIAKEPALVELKGEVPVLVYWNGANCLIR